MLQIFGGQLAVELRFILMLAIGVNLSIRFGYVAIYVASLASAVSVVVALSLGVRAWWRKRSCLAEYIDADGMQLVGLTGTPR